MKTIKKEIAGFIWAKDIDNLTDDEFETYKAMPKDIIAYSRGQYGINACVWYVPTTGEFLKCTKISTRYYEL